MAGAGGAAQRVAALDLEAVGQLAHAPAELGELRRHGADAVRLLDPQLRGAGDPGRAAREERRGGEDRELVDRLGHQLGRHVDAAQAARRGGDVGHRLAADLPPAHEAHPGAHRAQDLEEAGARRVHADVADGDLGVRGDHRGRDQERRGGGVAGDRQVARVPLAARGPRPTVVPSTRTSTPR